jgi:hypothetical protein
MRISPELHCVKIVDWIWVALCVLLGGACVGMCSMIHHGCEEEKARNTALMDKCIAKIKPLHLGPSEAQAALDLCWKTEGDLP